MPVTVSHNSKEIVEQLIRNAFHKVNTSMDYVYNEADRLITTAKEFGLNELAEELTNCKA